MKRKLSELLINRYWRYSTVFNFPETDITVVITGGTGYIMCPDQATPIHTFGGKIQMALLSINQEVVAADSTNIIMIDRKGYVWMSDRILWDGIKDLFIQDNTVQGKADDLAGWNDFTLDLTTKQVNGSSYRMK